MHFLVWSTQHLSLFLTHSQGSKHEDWFTDLLKMAQLGTDGKWTNNMLLDSGIIPLLPHLAVGTSGELPAKNRDKSDDRSQVSWGKQGGHSMAPPCDNAVTLLLAFIRWQQPVNHIGQEQLTKMNLILGKGPVAASKVQRQKKKKKIYNLQQSLWCGLHSPDKSLWGTSVLGIMTLRKNILALPTPPTPSRNRCQPHLVSRFITFRVHELRVWKNFCLRLHFLFMNYLLYVQKKSIFYEVISLEVKHYSTTFF